MKSRYKTLSCPTFFLFGFLLLLGFAPGRVFALSGEGDETFSNGTITNWTLGACTAAYSLSLNTTMGPSDSPPDPSAQNGIVEASPAHPACPVTITYTDPGAGTAGTQNYVMVDIYTNNVARSVEMIATDINGNAVTALAGSSDILPTCFTSSPLPVGTTTKNVWQTVFVSTQQGPTPLNAAVTTVQLIIQDNGTMGTVTGWVLLDNLRGTALLTCFTPTNTATNTSTNTATQTSTQTPTLTPTNTPVSSFTFTNTPTQTATNTATTTVTQTATQSATNTATNTTTKTPTNTATNTPTNTASLTNTAQYTNTATQTQTNTATNTTTLTPFITSTFTITPTFTPAPCQPEVYPNPMDFTASHNESNVPASACPTGKCIVFSCVPFGSTVKIYTVSLSLVRSFDSTAVVGTGTLPANVGLVAWDGTNGSGGYAASGLYFYVVNGPGTNTFGKFAISRSQYGP